MIKVICIFVNESHRLPLTLNHFYFAEDSDTIGDIFSIGKKSMIEALKLYAEQAIDECAKSATTYTVTFCSPHMSEWEKRVDTSSILKVKQMLE